MMADYAHYIVWLGALPVVFLFMLSVDVTSARAFGALCVRRGLSRPAIIRVVAWSTATALVLGGGFAVLANSGPDGVARACILLFLLIVPLLLIALLVRRKKAAPQEEPAEDEAVQKEAAPSPPAASSGSATASAVRSLTTVLILGGIIAFTFLVPLEKCSTCAGIGKLEIFGQALTVCDRCEGDGQVTIWEMIRSRGKR